jgi:hypothetical protein
MLIDGTQLAQKPEEFPLCIVNVCLKIRPRAIRLASTFTDDVIFELLKVGLTPVKFGIN